MSDVLFSELFKKYIDGSATPREMLLLKDFVQNGEYTAEHHRLLQEAYMDKSLRMQGGEDMEGAWHSLRGRMREPRIVWFRSAAAVLLLVAGAATFLYLNNRAARKEVARIIKLQPDIQPGGTKAILTLANGKTIFLDSAANGQLSRQGNTSVVKTANGRIIYEQNGADKGEAMMNLMSTPKGGQYQVVLPDGTRVWLNAASSLKYPVAFVGNDRRVSISGEAYFEVAKNKQMPFFVDVDGKLTVEVIGTSFNVNAYANESKLLTTLLEGSVKVVCQALPANTPSLKRESGAVILMPGEQATLDAGPGRSLQSGQLIGKNRHADLARVIAWKNGLFSLENSSLQEVMRQLERWYDVTVKYEGSIPEVEFKGEMDRGVRLSDFMRYMKELGINSRIEGRSLIIAGK